MKEDSTTNKTPRKQAGQATQPPPATPDGRAKAEMLRNFSDPFHPNDRCRLRSWIRMTGGSCSGGGGPC